ncbi:MAG TPA: GNAT family N-acetyltransferase [Holophaga sp.]|nr:GNAT family N-acetyltransferase [Holophaga sp.]
MSDRDAPCLPGFRYVLADSISFLNPVDWDAVVARSGTFLSRAFLVLMEEHLPANLTTHYALVYRGSTPLVAVVGQSLEIHVADLPAGLMAREGTGWWRSVRAATGQSFARAQRRILIFDRPTPEAALREMWPEVASELWHRVWKTAEQVAEASVGWIHQRFLVCGNLLSWGPHGVAFAAGEDPARLWPAVVEALDRIQRSSAVLGDSDLMMVKDLTDEQPEAGPALHHCGFSRFETEPNMVFQPDPSWADFADYLKALKSDYRSGIRHTFEALERAGITLECLRPEQVQDMTSEIQALYRQVHDRQKLRLVDIQPGWIPALALRFRDDFRTIAARPRGGGPLQGFISLIRDGDGALGYYVGFNKAAAAQGVPLYLGLFYSALGQGIEMGARRISLGRTALGPKAQVGAKAQAMHGFLRHRNTALNLAVPSVLALLPAPRQAPGRAPFRS